jgi:DNA primase
MPIFTKESLETLRQRIDLVDVISAHADLKRFGASYKSVCPFHEEKTPSFVVQRGDSHYHCFGCGAHGDAIEFLMEFLHLSFVEAVESLAERFNVPLEIAESGKPTQDITQKKKMREVLQASARFYHFYLLKTQEGKEALKYLYSRGLDEEFVKTFYLGLAPSNSGIMLSFLKSRGFYLNTIEVSGLLRRGREFFQERILFPIRDYRGAIIGFSGRKIQESTFGGKYINTPETPLFKKSSVLYGLNYCRRRIAKEKKVLIVEGQIDALRLIYEGLNYTVAGQGTAFGSEGVMTLLQLGVEKVFLGFDGDTAGVEASIKVGDMFQSKGIEVFVMLFAKDQDPDALISESGIEGVITSLDNSVSYLNFLVEALSKKWDIKSPSGKNAIVKEITTQLQSWEDTILVHESLRLLARLVDIPESLILKGQQVASKPFNKTHSKQEVKKSVVSKAILEMDLLQSLLFCKEEQAQVFAFIQSYVKEENFLNPVCRRLYVTYKESIENNQPTDLLSLASSCDSEQVQRLVNHLSKRRLPDEFIQKHLEETVRKLLEKSWMKSCEELKQKIQSGHNSEDVVLQLAKEFSELRKSPPEVGAFVSQ